MTLSAQELISNYLGQNKNRKVFIGIDSSIDFNISNNFLDIFISVNSQVFSYCSNQKLIQNMNLFKGTIYILLAQKEVNIEKINNDSRLFVFNVLNSTAIQMNIEKTTHKINVNQVINNFMLLDIYIKYLSLDSSLYVDISGTHGFGLYTNKKIKKRTNIFKLNGKIVNSDYINGQKYIGEWNALPENMYLVRSDRTSYGFINHDRDPNCEINSNTMNVMAKRDIEKNSELLLDYREEPLSQEYINKFGKNYL